MFPPLDFADMSGCGVYIILHLVHQLNCEKKDNLSRGPPINYQGVILIAFVLIGDFSW